jgi:hypothetical protein
MKIDRSNYEVWLIDWIDGNLNEIQIEQLKYFLMDNPDIQSEFEELSIVRLNPTDKSYNYKHSLEKTPADLSDQQFEYLSIAYLEKDLTPEQEADLEECVENDPEKKRSFDIIQKTKLSPVKIHYTQKKRLKRRTIARKFLLISLYGLSTAAIISLVIFNFFTVPQQLQVKSEKTASSVINDTISVPSSEPQKVPGNLPVRERSIPKNKLTRTILAISDQSSREISAAHFPPPDSMSRSRQIMKLR